MKEFSIPFVVTFSISNNKSGFLAIARENKTLYVDGLTGGLKTTPTQTTKKVGGHTFFGN